MTIQCSHCGKTLHLKPESAGKKGKCPACRQIIMIPRIDEEPAAPPAAAVSPDLEASINTETPESYDASGAAISDDTEASIDAETPGVYDESGAAISDDTEASINTDNAETPGVYDENGAAISDDMEASINIEAPGSYDASGPGISARETGAKLLKWLLIFGALFVLVFAVTIGGLMLYSALTK